jgi:hypothetical protein
MLCCVLWFCCEADVRLDGSITIMHKCAPEGLCYEYVQRNVIETNATTHGTIYFGQFYRGMPVLGSQIGQ